MLPQVIVRAFAARIYWLLVLVPSIRMAHHCNITGHTLLYTTCHSCLFCILTLQNHFYQQFVLGGLATECSATCQCPSVSIKDRVRKCVWKRACNTSSVCWPGTSPCIYKTKKVLKVPKKVKKKIKHFWRNVIPEDDGVLESFVLFLFAIFLNIRKFNIHSLMSTQMA